MYRVPEACIAQHSNWCSLGLDGSNQAASAAVLSNTCTDCHDSSGKPAGGLLHY